MNKMKAILMFAICVLPNFGHATEDASSSVELGPGEMALDRTPDFSASLASDGSGFEFAAACSGCILSIDLYQWNDGTRSRPLLLATTVPRFDYSTEQDAGTVPLPLVADGQMAAYDVVATLQTEQGFIGTSTRTIFIRGTSKGHSLSTWADFACSFRGSKCFVDDTKPGNIIFSLDESESQ